MQALLGMAAPSSERGFQRAVLAAPSSSFGVADGFPALTALLPAVQLPQGVQVEASQTIPRTLAHGCELVPL